MTDAEQERIAAVTFNLMEGKRSDDDARMQSQQRQRADSKLKICNAVLSLMIVAPLMAWWVL